MKHVQLILIFTLLSGTLQASSADAAITDEERTAAVSYLEETRDTFRTLVDGLDEAQFHHRAAPDRWSIAEITEHLVKVENLVYGQLTSRLLTSPAHPEWLADGKPLLRDHVIRMAVTNRDARTFSAPEILAPGPEQPSREASIASFVDARNRTIELARTSDVNLRVHFMPNPALGMLDGYQWLLFVAGHTERHTIQAREVMASPTFPGTLRPITKEERAWLVDDLHRSEERLEDLVRGLTEEQLAYRESEDRWSIANVVEHLARAESLLFSLVESTLENSAPQPELKGKDGSPRVKDLVFVMAITNREAKRFEAPKPLQPSGEFSTPQEALASFRTRRAETIDFVLMTQFDLRAWFHENRGFGQMDAYQWLLLLSAHTDRHAQQIEEIKASEGYPE